MTDTAIALDAAWRAADLEAGRSGICQLAARRGRAEIVCGGPMCNVQRLS